MAQNKPTPESRLLLVVDSLDVGGAERHVVELASALVRSGWPVTIACSTEGALAAVARRADVDVRPLLGSMAKRRLSLAYALRMAVLVRSERFVLVHAHMFASAAAAALATGATHVPLVITEHSEATWRTPRVRWCSRHVYRRAARVIAVSDSIRRRLITDDGVPPERVTTIRNACPTPLDYGAPLPPDVPSWSARGPLVGVVARLQPEKGVQYFIEAASQVARANPDAHFVVIGDGPLRDSMSRLAHGLGIGDRTLFTGFRLDAPQLVRTLDVLVVPSLSEGTPLVILEAMSAGVAIVASAVGGIPEQVCHGREALLVPAGDARALASVLTRVLQNPGLAHRLGQAGRRRAAACFSPDTLRVRTEAVYRAALRSPARLGAETLGLAPPSPH